MESVYERAKLVKHNGSSVAFDESENLEFFYAMDFLFANQIQEDAFLSNTFLQYKSGEITKEQIEKNPGQKTTVESALRAMLNRAKFAICQKALSMRFFENIGNDDHPALSRNEVIQLQEEVDTEVKKAIDYLKVFKEDYSMIMGGVLKNLENCLCESEGYDGGYDQDEDETAATEMSTIFEPESLAGDSLVRLSSMDAQEEEK